MSVDEDEAARVRQILSEGQQRATMPAGWLSRALSIRVIFLSFLVGVCAAVVFGVAFPSVNIPTMTLVWPVAAVCYVIAIMNGAQMVKCDACLKRVKMGASRCHHCGYSRA